MPAYAIKTTKQTKLLGAYSSREEALKLRIFKQHPELCQYLVELPPLTTAMIARAVSPRVPRSSNRWRLLLTTCSVDWLSTRTREEAEKFAQETLLPETEYKLILVPTYAYHKSDDEQQLS